MGLRSATIGSLLGVRPAFVAPSEAGPRPAVVAAAMRWDDGATWDGSGCLLPFAKPKKWDPEATWDMEGAEWDKGVWQ